LPVGDVLPGAVIPVFLGQTEVDKKELVAVASDPHQEVIRLNIPAKKERIKLCRFCSPKILSILYMASIIVLSTRSRCSSQSELYLVMYRFLSIPTLNEEIQ
jgi:hypothetical protein